MCHRYGEELLASRAVRTSADSSADVRETGVQRRSSAQTGVQRRSLSRAPIKSTGKRH